MLFYPLYAVKRRFQFYLQLLDQELSSLMQVAFQD